MAANRSFKDYISNRFYSELFNAVSDYLEANLASLDFQSATVRNVDSAELSDITVKMVYVDDLPGMMINLALLPISLK